MKLKILLFSMALVGMVYFYTVPASAAVSQRLQDYECIFAYQNYSNQFCLFYSDDPVILAAYDSGPYGGYYLTVDSSYNYGIFIGNGWSSIQDVKNYYYNNLNSIESAGSHGNVYYHAPGEIIKGNIVGDIPSGIITPTPSPIPLPTLVIEDWWYQWTEDNFENPEDLQAIGGYFKEIINGTHGGGHSFSLPSGYPSPTPTPLPTPTPIPYSTVINPTTGQVEYHWNDPTLGPTMSLQPPTNSPGPGSGNGSGVFPTPPYETKNYYYPEDPLAIPGDSPEIPPIQMGSGTISMRDLPDVYEDIDNNLEEYSDGINAATDTFAVFPTKWILAIGTICCITIIASAISRLLH